MRRPEEKFTTHSPAGSAGDPYPTSAPEVFKTLAEREPAPGGAS